MKNFITNISISIMCLFMFTACSPAPSDEIVTSKNDGMFDSTIAVESSIKHNGKEIKYVINDEFDSLDNSVHFTCNINKNIKLHDMPVVKVVPHGLTVDDAKVFSKIVFKDLVLYEENPEPILSKSEIIERIQTWTKYISNDSLKKLYGNAYSENELNDFKKLIQDFITDYSKMLSTAPEDSSKEPCHWTFYPNAHYFFDKEMRESAKDNGGPKQIRATTSGPIPYTFIVTNRNGSDYQLNNINVYINNGTSPRGISDQITKYNLCQSAAPPSDVQIENIKVNAQTMLNSIGLGDWYIDSCTYSPLVIDQKDSYIVKVTAVPEFQNIAAIRQVQLLDLVGAASYASNYYLTDAELIFSANGDLMNFNIMSPVDVSEICNNNVQTLELDELWNIAKQRLSLNDSYEYAQRVIVTNGHKYTCTVDVSEMEYGLTRIKARNEDNTYYYIPAVTYRGHYQIFENGSNTACFDSYSWWSGEPQTLLVLNAIDGSIIDVANGY